MSHRDYKAKLESGEVEPHDFANGKHYSIGVPLYESTLCLTLESKYEEMTVYLNRQLDKFKVWSALKLWTQRQKLQKKHLDLLQKVHEQEEHDMKLESLLKDEVDQE